MDLFSERSLAELYSTAKRFRRPTITLYQDSDLTLSLILNEHSFTTQRAFDPNCDRDELCEILLGALVKPSAIVQNMLPQIIAKWPRGRYLVVARQTAYYT